MTELVARGRHRAQARHFQLGYAGSDDKEQVVVGFELTDPEDPDCGRFLSAFLFLTDKTFDRTVESLRHCGWEGDDLAELPGLIDTGWIAQDVELVVDHEEWDNAWQAKVKWINKPGGGGAVKLKKPLEGQALTTFAAQMKGRIRAAGAGGPRTTTQKPKPANSGAPAQRAMTHPNAPGNGVDDDIPF